MGLNHILNEKKVHYTMWSHYFFSWLTATVEPFFPTPPARMTDMLLCASKIAMPTAAHNGNTFTSVPVYGNCISDTKDLSIRVVKEATLQGLSNTPYPWHFSLLIIVKLLRNYRRCSLLKQFLFCFCFFFIILLTNHNL